MKIRTLLTTILTLTLLAACHAQTLDQAKLDQFFDRLATRNQAMGSLVIAKEGKVVYSRAIGYGEINGAEKKPLTAASRFRIGSITKMFTAVIIFQLAEEKKLSLSDTLDQYLPQIPNAPKITIAQILQHRSGIPNVFGGSVPEPWPKTDPITPKQTLERIAKSKPDFEPDTKSQYSNTGYTVLGLIIEKITGKSYREAVQARIASRIGLNDTYVATSAIDVTKGETLAYQHFPAGWRQREETHATLLFSGGAIVSTPYEMVKFIHALFAGKLVSPESLAAMKTIRDGEGMGMAPPFEWEGKTFYGETGGGDNRGAWLAYLPEEKLAIAYATNAKVYPVADIMKGIAAIYYGRPFEIPAWNKVEVSPETLKKYVGVYVNPPARFTISVKDSTLYVQPGTGSASPMEAKAENRFEITAGVSLEFDVEKGQMTLKRPQGDRVFTREP